MLGVKEIREKTFDKTFGFGYRMDGVDAYLAQAADSMQQLMENNADLEKKIEVLADKLTEYREDEESLRMALLGAQKLGDSVIRESKTKAEIIMREATIKSEAMLENARRKIELERESLEKLQDEVSAFKNRLLTIYKQHLEVISALPGKGETVPSAAAAGTCEDDDGMPGDTAVKTGAAEPGVEPTNLFGDTMEDEKQDIELEEEVVDALDEDEKKDPTQSRFGDLRFGEPYISRFTPDKHGQK
jgi:cell division initiation protein